MSKIIDIYADSSQNYEVLRKIESRLPAFVKQADLQPQDVIPEKSWALLVKTASGEYEKYFPINNMVNARLSLEYLVESRDGMTKKAFEACRKRIVDALEMFGQKVAAEVAPVELEVNTLSTEQQIKNWKDLILKTLMDGKQGLNTSINAFRLYYLRLRPDEQFEVASKIIDRATELNVPIPKESRLYRYKLVDAHTMSKHAETVVKMRFGFYNQDLCKTAGMLLRDLDKIEPIEAARKLHELDKLAGVDNRYEKDLPDPFIHMFSKHRFSVSAKPSMMTKEAEAKMAERFDEEFIKAAKEDLGAAYKSLGKYGRRIMRQIFKNTKFQE